MKRTIGTLLLLALLCLALLPALPAEAGAAEPDPGALPRDMTEAPEPEGEAELAGYAVSDEDALPSFTWSNVQLFPGKHSGLVMARANASRTGTFTWSALRLWTPEGALIAEVVEEPKRNSDYYWFWYDLSAEGCAPLKSDGTYLCQMELKFDGYVFRSPEFVLRPQAGPGLRRGVDVSQWQGEIDWTAAAEHIDFAILRCGYGSDLKTQDDKQWARNAESCERLGIPYGVYLFSYADTEDKARSEAAHALRLLEGYSPDLPVYYDLEHDGTTGKCTDAQILRFAEIFCGTLEAAGYRAGIYTGGNWWKTRFTDARFGQWDKWVASWGGWHTAEEDYSLWQFSCRGQVPGISGNVDLDLYFHDPRETRSGFVAELDCGDAALRYEGETDGACRVYAALYDPEGQLLDAEFYDKAAGEARVRLSLDGDRAAAGSSVKLFCVDGESGPLVPPAVWERVDNS